MKVQRSFVERIAAVRAKLFAAIERKENDAIARHTNAEVVLQVQWNGTIEEARGR
jgi:hypothetical protein